MAFGVAGLGLCNDIRNEINVRHGPPTQHSSPRSLIDSSWAWRLLNPFGCSIPTSRRAARIKHQYAIARDRPRMAIAALRNRVVCFPFSNLRFWPINLSESLMLLLILPSTSPICALRPRVSTLMGHIARGWRDPFRTFFRGDMSAYLGTMDKSTEQHDQYLKF